jgi:hypothetical protein
VDLWAASGLCAFTATSKLEKAKALGSDAVKHHRQPDPWPGVVWRIQESKCAQVGAAPVVRELELTLAENELEGF